MAHLPEPLAGLISELSKLPGVGPRSAERIALHLVQSGRADTRLLADAIVNASEKIQPCQICGALTEIQPCGICGDARRDPSLICVVERAVDILSLEKSGIYHGRYHVLGGKISPVDGIGPEDLRIAQLEQRLVEQPGIQEIIIALGSDVEGDATSYYLAKRLAPKGVKVTRLAQGMAVGASLEYADELTLGRAIEGRRALES
jgi:recombination protein RecR